MNAFTVPGEPDRLRLRNTELDIIVLPGKGADIYSIIDRASGIDVLFKAPWDWQDPASFRPSGDSQRDWLARYPGGWQQLVPNAGAPRPRGGYQHGYHGEAAIAEWQLHDHTDTTAQLSTRLLLSPLRLTRSLSLDGPVLRVRDTVANEGREAIEVMWVQHPGFGAPFIDEHCRLDFGATTLISDADAPGTALAPDTSFDVTAGLPRSAGERDVRAVPAPHSGSSSFGCLTDFRSGWYSISSPTAGFGIRLDWDTDVYPHAWFWQECHASPDHPWYRQAYVIAIEPANVLPGDPSAGCADRGITPLLAPGDEWVSEVTFTRTALA